MTPPVDPNDVLMTGENSFIRLSEDGGKTMTDRLSHWRVLWCPDGAGHALFVHSTLLDGQVRIYSDNPPVARWLQKTIETLLYPAFADEKLPIASAKFTRAGDARSTASEEVVAGNDRLRLTWRDFIEPFVLARAAQVEMNGKTAKGQPWAETRGDRQSSSACLAWSETWVKPK